MHQLEGETILKRKVVLTGAAGTIAGPLLPVLRKRYDLTLLDIREKDRLGNPVQGIKIADLLNRGRDTYRQHFRGVDSVVHCGFVRARDPEDHDQRFWVEYANVEMAYNVYQTCWEENVRRVIVTGSNRSIHQRLRNPNILPHRPRSLFPIDRRGKQC